MKPAYSVLLLCLYLVFTSFSKAEKIINPIKIDKDSNPVKYQIIYKSETAEITSLSTTLEMQKNFVKFPHSSYLLSKPLFICQNEGGSLFAFLGDRYFQFQFNSDNEVKESTIMNQKSLPSEITNIQFTDYIIASFYSGQGLFRNRMASTTSQEIIFYGKEGENVYFYYKNNEKFYIIQFGVIDDHVSCQLLKEAIYVCAYSQNKQIYLKFLVLTYLEDANSEDKELKDIETIYIGKLNYHDSAIIYNTANSDYKIVCGRYVGSDNNILCVAVNFNFVYSYSTVSFSTSEITVYDINNYEASFLFGEDYCDSISFNSEFLICCKTTSGIICDRRDVDKFLLINKFNLELSGQISNLTLDSGDDYVKLIFYKEEENTEQGIYEYYIYPPNCNNLTLNLNSYQTLILNLDDFFLQKTNTKYNITFLNNLYTNLMFTSINGQRIYEDYIMQLENDENYINFTSKTTSTTSKLFKYNVSISETYSNLCTMRIYYKPCYSSCKSCSVDLDNSDSENHNCVGCKEGYYPFIEKQTNCYSLEDAPSEHPDWYLDGDDSIFKKCNSACKTCNGPTEENCLSCPLDANNAPLYLYNGKCLSECPTGTFLTDDGNGNYFCQDCYINCLTCNEAGIATDMKCESCSNDKIIHEKECYIVNDPSIKSFYNPEDNSIITSCYELHNEYIKEDTNICIPNIEEGYYISNSVTGLLSRCDSNCKTCSQSSTHCDSCNDGFFLQENICVSGCTSNYYLDNTNCFKCHDNCLNCLSGKELGDTGNLINMKCSQCLDNMIKVEENCFPKIDYTSDKITFDISEINSENPIGTCLSFNKAIFYDSYECIVRPEHTFYVVSGSDNTGVIKYCDSACDTCLGEKIGEDTNCINCAVGYYKTEDSNTNCILESLIPDNYHKNELDNIYYKDKPTTQVVVSSCDEDLFITLTGDCVSQCPSGSYKFLLNHTCLESCPTNYIINTEQNECILKPDEPNEDDVLTTSKISPNINIIEVEIEDLPEEEANIKILTSFIRSNFSTASVIKQDYTKVILTTENMDIEEQLDQGVSAIDLGNCTIELKEYYQIPTQEELIVLNKESNTNINSSALGKYNKIDVYDYSLRRLNLSVCNEEVTIVKYIGDVVEELGLDVETAKEYQELGIDIYNASSEFFNDLCYEYDSNDGKDITLEDRRNDIYQNVSFCQEGCTYGGINYDLMAVNCICDTSSIQSENVTNEGDDSNISKFEGLVKTFLSNWLDFNIEVIYCYNLVFNGRIIPKNIGFLFMSSMFALQIIFLGVFLIKKLKPIKKFMMKSQKNKNEKEKEKEAPPKKDKEEKNKEENHKSKKDKDKKNKEDKIKDKDKDKDKGKDSKKDKKKKKHRHKRNYVSNNHLLSKSELSTKKCLDNEVPEKDYKHKVKMNNFVPVIYKPKDNLITGSKELISTKEKETGMGEVDIKIKFNKKNNKEKRAIKNSKINNNELIPVNEKEKDETKIRVTQKDEDLQDMEYEEAASEDKRSYLRMYWCFLVDSQIILGTFFTENYLDLLIIKLSFLIFTFQISFFLNAFFYTDEYISDAYHNEGVLDFFTGLPKAIYSFIATLIITNLLGMLSTSKSELIKIVREKQNEKDYTKLINQKLKKLKIKLIIYFILVFLLGLAFFYYVAAFCAVYRNSQKYWFIGCITSFALDSSVAIIICLILAALRYIAIVKKVKCLYVFGNIIHIFL